MLRVPKTNRGRLVRDLSENTPQSSRFGNTVNAPVNENSVGIDAFSVPAGEFAQANVDVASGLGAVVGDVAAEVSEIDRKLERIRQRDIKVAKAQKQLEFDEEVNNKRIELANSDLPPRKRQEAFDSYLNTLTYNKSDVEGMTPYEKASFRKNELGHQSSKARVTYYNRDYKAQLKQHVTAQAQSEAKTRLRIMASFAIKDGIEAFPEVSDKIVGGHKARLSDRGFVAVYGEQAEAVSEAQMEEEFKVYLSRLAPQDQIDLLSNESAALGVSEIIGEDGVQDVLDSAEDSIEREASKARAERNRAAIDRMGNIRLEMAKGNYPTNYQIKNDPTLRDGDKAQLLEYNKKRYEAQRKTAEQIKRTEQVLSGQIPRNELSRNEIAKIDASLETTFDKDPNARVNILGYYKQNGHEIPKALAKRVEEELMGNDLNKIETAQATIDQANALGVSLGISNEALRRNRIYKKEGITRQSYTKALILDRSAASRPNTYINAESIKEMDKSVPFKPKAVAAGLGEDDLELQNFLNTTDGKQVIYSVLEDYRVETGFAPTQDEFEEELKERLATLPKLEDGSGRYSTYNVRTATGLRLSDEQSRDYINLKLRKKGFNGDFILKPAGNGAFYVLDKADGDALLEASGNPYIIGPHNMSMNEFEQLTNEKKKKLNRKRGGRRRR